MLITRTFVLGTSVTYKGGDSSDAETILEQVEAAIQADRYSPTGLLRESGLVKSYSMGATVTETSGEGNKKTVIQILEWVFEYRTLASSPGTPQP